MPYYGLTHEATVSHAGLGKTRTFRGRDYMLVQQRANNQMVTWDQQWARRLAHEDKVETRERGLQEAQDRTKEARDAIAAWRNVFEEHIDTITISWEHQEEPFPEPKPSPESFQKAPVLPPQAAPNYLDTETERRFKQGIASQPLEEKYRYPDYIEPAPKDIDARYRVPPGLGSFFNTAAHKQKVAAAQAAFQRDSQAWNLKAGQHRQKIRASVAQEIADKRLEYNGQVEQVKRENEAIAQRNKQALDDWNAARVKHQAHQAALLAASHTARQDFAKGKKDGVAYFMDKLAHEIQWPVFSSGEFDWEYQANGGGLVIDMELPDPDDAPTIKEVKYVISRQEFQEVLVKDKERGDIYDTAVYQLVLKMLHDVVSADEDGVFDSVTVNGIVESINRATGKPQVACILSIHATPDQVRDIDFTNIDPKACFRSLKGVGSSQLHALAAVAPIVVMNKKDKRFVAPEDVSNVMSNAPNVATMDWKDFEHLVRELFEKEFGANGSEVKITRASRDAGVDAVIFDPDPIRGGKIVVQAKRYTHTVDVSAVRDLYGTVLNEGAMTGILVTTSEYGPDAYAFAKDKPLKLLTGGNLLHLLTKHGYKARLDLKEAKAMLREHGARGGRLQNRPA